MAKSLMVCVRHVVPETEVPLHLLDSGSWAESDRLMPITKTVVF